MPFSGGSSVPVMRSAVGFTPPGPWMPAGALPLFLLLVPPGGGGVSLTPEAAPKPLDQCSRRIKPQTGKVVPGDKLVLRLCSSCVPARAP